MKDFIKVMKALSDPNRVKIVKMLQHKTMCVCELREALQRKGDLRHRWQQENQVPKGLGWQKIVTHSLLHNVNFWH